VGGIVGYLLFFLAGVGFGYAAPTKWRWLPILFPLALGLWALFKYGPDASVLIRLVLALIITVLGIFVGAMLDARSGENSEHARYA
jgi:ABC-type microcin C transport system permease subunit YejE